MIASAGRRTETGYFRRLVLERLHRLFVIVIVLQLIQVFKDYWWPETYAVVYVSVAAAAAIELLVSRAFALRLALQLAAVLAAVMLLAPYDWSGWPDGLKGWEAVRIFAIQNGKPLHPFFEIGAGVVLIIHYMAYLGTNKIRAIGFILMSIATLAIIDSFFPLELWTNIAWAVLAGLGWLVVLHLRQLKERHFDSWSALAERPFELAVPAIIVIGLLMLAGIAVPRAPVLLEDPYTMWLQAQNKEVPAFSGEGGYIAGGDSSDAGSSRSSKSGYGRSDTKIGGGFEFDYSPVMTVDTNQKGYWRGETKAVYTGQGWTDRRGMDTTPAAPGQDELPDEEPTLEGIQTKQVTQTFTILRKDRLPVLFGAGPISGLSEWKGVSGSAKLTWNKEEQELKFQRAATVESYTVVSDMIVIDEDKLRTTRSGGAEAPFDLAPYEQLPAVPARVAELAATIAAGSSSDYDKAKALESYLRLNYPYTNTPDVSLQKSKDIADAFLFEIKEGYCDYYSTAFVVLARSLGLPTRWVKGYAAGSNRMDEEGMRNGLGYIPDPNGAGSYTVRNADAHSWAEVYFEGVGWVPFEPTSGFTVPQPIAEGAPSPTPDVPADADGDATEETETADQAGGWSAGTWAIAGASLIVVGVAALLVRRRAWTTSVWRRVRYRGATPNQRIVREMERLLAFLGRRGLKRSQNDTLRESFLAWSGRFASLRPEFEGVLHKFESARYGGQAGGEGDLEQFTAMADKIRKSL
ncbi:DUF4129 domain-containing transglutaminase family protein [Cohnella sp. JJ-181]|uniref:DUF4129 domain-containing transglutaminase family protein n=1 Tax=Cohnella rhizoplanae TaxID=2974897 RepID=UPI00232EBED7|nr:transglutaminase domain-containing protein [Cohnella sp. JJ-181]